MFSSAEKTLENFDRITEFSNSVGNSLENYIAARTAIRDYVISGDEKYYAQVEQRLVVANEGLLRAESLAMLGETSKATQQIRELMHGWGLMARQVRDAFAAYRAVEGKVLASFDTLVHRGGVLLQTNPTQATGVILDVQTANVAMTGYVLKSEERLAENAQLAINWAKEKIEQMAQGEGQMNIALQSFSTNLDACAEGLREAVSARRNAYQLFHDILAPLGVRIQTDFELFRQQAMEQQRKVTRLS